MGGAAGPLTLSFALSLCPRPFALCPFSVREAGLIRPEIAKYSLVHGLEPPL